MPHPLAHRDRLGPPGPPRRWGRAGWGEAAKAEGPGGSGPPAGTGGEASLNLGV
jgi:hypothetical protein